MRTVRARLPSHIWVKRTRFPLSVSHRNVAPYGGKRAASGNVEPGEVLVCPFTDAAWTPLFFDAAAVVMDLGGPLSHGATVAREYGLPAVANVKIGTRLIQDGAEITVDGAAGEVTAHAGVS